MEGEPRTDLDRLLDLAEAGEGFFVTGASETLNAPPEPKTEEEPPRLAS